MTKAVIDWQARYEKGDIGWDMGTVSPALKAYFDQLKNKQIRILIPGGGNGYEATYLHEQGFKQVYLLDIAAKPLKDFAKKHPDFPEEHLLLKNFFEHEGKYDLMVEQTFFCAIHLSDRMAYAKKAASLLSHGGKLVGLLWSKPMNQDQPPFGGSKEEYHLYFDPYFDYLHFSPAINSIPPRSGNELFLLAQKKEAEQH